MERHVVVGFDGSPASRAAFDWAVDEAARSGWSLRVVSSYAMPPVMDVYGMGTAAATAEQVEQLRAAYQTDIDAAVGVATLAHPEVSIEVILTDQPAARMLLEAAADPEAVAAVLGSNGMGAVKSFLLGSVAGELLHHSACPVVIVPAESHAPTGRVAVGIDGRPDGHGAVLWAADLAQRRGAELVVVHGWEYPYRISGDGRGAELVEVDAAVAVDRAIEAARQRVGVPVSGRSTNDGAVDALVAASEDADLVVVGTRGRGAVRAIVLGSVSAAVCAHARCPVAVIR